MPHRSWWRALALTSVLLAVSPMAGQAATPAPQPTASPTAAPSCAIPPGMEGDTQEQALAAKCKAEQAKIQTEKAKLSDNLALAQGTSDSLQQMLKQTRDAIVANQKLQDQTVVDIHNLEMHEAATAAEVVTTKRRLALRRSQYADYLRRSYKYQPDIVAEIIESKGVSDFLSRAAALLSIRNYGSHLLHSIQDEEHRLQQEYDQIRADHDAAVKKQKDLSDAQNQLIASEVKEATILSALQGSIKAGQSELDQAAGQSAALVAQIVAAQIAREDDLIQAANDAAWAAAQAWMASNNIVSPKSANHSSTPFIWPAKGTITQGFGATDYAAEPPGFGAAHFHAGIDIANNSGTAILAADDGVVVATEDSVLNGHLIGYGRHVIIAHRHPPTATDPNPPTVLTLYGHLEGYIVKVGQEVHQGDQIGMMGSTGNSSGPHVHFEVRIDNSPVNPLGYLPQVSGTTVG